MYKQNKIHSRQNKKNAVPMSKLVIDTLSRHGIGKQVQSAMIVKEGNKILDLLLDRNYRNDIRVLSFSNNTLTVVCRHGASSHLANSIRIELQRKIEENIPSANITDIYIKVDQKLLDSSADSLI